MRKTLVVIIVAVLVFIAAVAIFSSSLPGSISAESKIAVISIHGTIAYSENSFFDASANPTDIIELLEQAENDPAYKAILLEINSPGGSPVAADEIAQKIKSINKTTVAWIGDVGASGGYWVASAADKVVAHPLSITCSIGAVGILTDYSELLETIGINTTTLTYGEYKDIGSPYHSVTTEEAELIQNMIDDVGIYFVEIVSENRNIPPSVVQDIADGSPCLGQKAYALGLVDELGNEDDAIALAAELANIRNPKPVRLDKSDDFLSELFGVNVEKSFYSMGFGLGESLKSEEKFQLIS